MYDEPVLEKVGVGGCLIRLSQPVNMDSDIYQAREEMSKGT